MGTFKICLWMMYTTNQLHSRNTLSKYTLFDDIRTCKEIVSLKQDFEKSKTASLLARIQGLLWFSHGLKMANKLIIVNHGLSFFIFAYHAYSWCIMLCLYFGQRLVQIFCKITALSNHGFWHLCYLSFSRFSRDLFNFYLCKKS